MPDIMEFAKAYRSIGTIAEAIINYLYTKGNFNGSYAELTVCIGRKAGTKGDESNVRKWCASLVNARIINIEDTPTWGKKHFVLNSDWQNQLIANIELISSSIMTKNKKDTVTTIVYGVTKVFRTRDEAKSFYLEAMINSDGSEHDRYAIVYDKLQRGLDICDDTNVYNL